MIVCPSCNNESADDAAFCGFCGKKLHSEGPKHTLFGVAGISREELQAGRAAVKAAAKPVFAEPQPGPKPEPKTAKKQSSAASLAAALQAKKVSSVQSLASLGAKASKPSIPRLGGKDAASSTEAGWGAMSIDLADLGDLPARETPGRDAPTLQDMPAASIGDTISDATASTFEMPVQGEDDKLAQAAGLTSPEAKGADEPEVAAPTLVQPQISAEPEVAEPPAAEVPQVATGPLPVSTASPEPAQVKAAATAAPAPVAPDAGASPPVAVDKSDEQAFFGSTLSRAYLTPAQKGEAVDIGGDLQKAKWQSYVALLAGILILAGIVAAFAYLMVVGGE